MYDVLIIGAGVAGYTAAIRASQEGLKVAIVEKDRIGGACLNRGCIPTKYLISYVSKFDQIKSMRLEGINLDGVHPNCKKLFENMNQKIMQMRQGISYLMKTRNITVIEGEVTFIDPHQVKIVSSMETQILYAETMIVATGARPKVPEIKGIESSHVIFSDDIFKEGFKIPKSITVVGGGYIGLEFAYFFHKMGSKVLVLEEKDRLLSNFDEEISTCMFNELRKMGIEVELNISVHEIIESGRLVYLNEKQARQTIESDKIFVSVGRYANIERLGLENIGIEVTEAGISVDKDFRTNKNHIFAIGDVIQGPQLAYVASAQAMRVIASIKNKKMEKSLQVIPYCIFTKPEVACVGEDEDSAKQKGFQFHVGKFLLSANGKAIIHDDVKGFIKIIIEDGTNNILGASILCNQASELINQITLAINNHITADQFLESLIPHPTYSEGILEAMESINDRCINMIRK